MQSEKNWDFNTSHVSINQRLHRDCEHQEAISIHLMFLLIGSGSLPKFLDANFNTSHVSINRVPSAITAFCFWKFNTSHVSINRGSSRTSQQHRKISIHLMFLLIRDSLEAALLGKISIHLMFLLITPQPIKTSTSSTISIHLMFLLIIVYPQIAVTGLGFQYISCFY